MICTKQLFVLGKNLHKKLQETVITVVEDCQALATSFIKEGCSRYEYLYISWLFNWYHKSVELIFWNGLKFNTLYSPLINQPWYFSIVYRVSSKPLKHYQWYNKNFRMPNINYLYLAITLLILYYLMLGWNDKEIKTLLNKWGAKLNKMEIQTKR